MKVLSDLAVLAVLCSACTGIIADAPGRTSSGNAGGISHHASDPTKLSQLASISDGNRHNHDDMPIILAGHGGGTLSPGRHVVFAANTRQKVSNLLVTMLGTAGIASATLGDSTGSLAGL